METQEFMGTGELIPRLIAQVGDASFAKSLAIKNGHLNPDGSYTAEGIYKNNMTAGERAVSRNNGMGMYHSPTNTTL